MKREIEFFSSLSDPQKPSGHLVNCGIAQTRSNAMVPLVKSVIYLWVAAWRLPAFAIGFTKRFQFGPLA